MVVCQFESAPCPCSEQRLEYAWMGQSGGSVAGRRRLLTHRGTQLTAHVEEVADLVVLQ